MNRTQRRAEQRKNAKARKKMWPDAFVDMANKEDYGLKPGDEFTIAGVKILPNGDFITDCKPGEESKLVLTDKKI